MHSTNPSLAMAALRISYGKRILSDVCLYTAFKSHVAKWGVKNEISFRSRTTSGCPCVQSLKLSEGSISDMEVQENGDLEP